MNTATRNGFQLRCLILAVIAVVSLLFLIAALRAPASLFRAYSGAVYPQVGVSFLWEREVVVVRVDDREESVPLSQTATSPIYQEAIRRIPANKRPAETRVLWSRVLYYWLAVTAFAWWVLFRLWQPPRPYIEGGPVA